jgi:1,4-dihydroxy-2-naphthoate octaprenyltransferase
MTNVMTENEIRPTNAPDRERAIRAIKILLFSASIVPAIVGGAIAASTGSFAWTPFLLAALGLFIGQAGGDYLYYYGTHFHTDARDAHTKIFAGWRPLFTGTLFAPERTVWAGALCLAVDLGIAVYFYQLMGTAILWFALAGGLIAIFFTPLMLRGWKEPVIFVTFGPLCVAGIVFALTGTLSQAAIVASLPVGFFVTVVAYLKSARFDVVDSGGEQVVLKLSRTVILVLLAFGYVSLVAGVALSYLPMWSLAGLLSLPLAWSVASIVRQSSSKVSEYLWATVRSIVILVVVGAGLAAGFLF